MKKKELFVIMATTCLLSLLLTSIVAAQPKPVTTKPVAGGITWKGITPWIAEYQLSKAFFIFQEVVREKTKGELAISYLGGEEVVPPFDQFEALRNGLVDVVLGCSAYYRPQVPEAASLLYTKKTGAELRKSGHFDLMQKIHLEKGNVIYLCNAGGGDAFRLYSNTKLEKPDLTGLRFRVSPVYIPLVKALKGTPIMMKPSELYLALERKVVDGFGWTVVGMFDYAFYEVTKYAIDHTFYSIDDNILINRSAWEKLPPHLRDILQKEVGPEVEIRWEKFFAQRAAADTKRLKDVGLQFVNLSEADAKTYLNTAYGEGWKDFLKECPKYGAEVKKLAE